MEEIVYYNSDGGVDEKLAGNSLGIATSIHSQSTSSAFRQVSSSKNGSVLTGTKPGDKLFVACKGKALINVYSWGKESPDQRIPVPEQLTSLALCNDSNDDDDNDNDDDDNTFNNDKDRKLPKFRTPYLLIGGGLSGKIYIWEISSGLLLNVKEAHYQPITVLKVSQDGSYLVSGGKDARVLVWSVKDLISFVKDDELPIKPIHVFSDHTLEITDIHINNNIRQDLKLYTTSKDSTVRIYNLANFQLLTTFVLSTPIESLIVDVADRAIFVGLSNGNIRQINLYEPNVSTNVLEAKGGYGQILTVPEDFELKSTITYHNPNPITKLALSIDGTLIVSGDNLGKVVVSDVVSKQVVKELKELDQTITNLQVLTHYNLGEEQVDKQIRSIPQFKRILTNNNPKEQEIVHQISVDVEDKSIDFESYLDRVSKEALSFANLGKVRSEVKLQDNDENVKQLETKVEKLTKAYKDIRVMYEDLYSEHSKLLKDQ